MIFPSTIACTQADAFWCRLKETVTEAVKAQLQSSPITIASTATPLLKVKEVCALLSVSRLTLYQWMHSGRLPSVKVGGRRFFHREQVQSLLQDCEKHPPQEDGFRDEVEAFLTSYEKGIHQEIRQSI
jgi:excisionase family DNA binding protein